MSLEIKKYETRQKIKDAFVNLRKQGYLARMNYLCCQTCAGYAMAERASELIDSGKKPPTGCVYWHNQDDDRWWSNGEMMLRYGQLFTDKHGDVGKPTDEVGKAVVLALVEQGVKCKWDGDPSHAIQVFAE